eukprot:TRINITY_DN4519_c0_g2_i2.p1 TRINITY_DN4519_c0_g2~~TRINITY_DN4519_c0_g2_i2.p1  ORF type:complete len:287 (+),score=54.65 TRINITY_DN4519_c0_g2_i2:47-907(+)
MCDALFKICFGGDEEANTENDGGRKASAASGSRTQTSTLRSPPSVEMIELCTICRKGFSLTVRRHECSKCNGAFCGDCMVKRPEKISWDGPRTCLGCEEKDKKSSESLSRVKRFEEDYASYLKTGVIFMKHGSTGFPHRRAVRISDDYMRIIWSDPTAVEEPREMLLEHAKISLGKSTNVMRRSAKSASEDCCFSIVGTQRTLDLEAESTVQRQRFVEAMEECLWVSQAILKDQAVQKKKKDEQEAKAKQQKLEIEQEAKARVEQRRREREERRSEKIAEIASRYK